MKSWQSLIRLLPSDILTLHARLERSTGIRDIGLIESAVNAPFQTFGGKFLYPTVEERAARLFCGLIKNHGFIDGNKRIALHATELYLMLCGFKLNCSQAERVAVTMKVAASRMGAEDFLTWLKARIDK